MDGLFKLSEGLVVGGDFRIVRPLASGGMGSVYLAEQLSTRKERALKVMKAELVLEPRLRERFAQEARVGAQIQSEHVVEVVGAGVDDQLHMPWLAMELLVGEDLAGMLKRCGPLPPLTVRAILEQAGHALGAAHRAGIVHRDLKPENIFVAQAHRVGVEFSVKLLDFGVAKLLSQATGGGASTTSVGTPRWMAPEQTEGGSHIGPRADVWAMGLIAFTLLTGRSYWLQCHAESPSIATLLREILFDPLCPASERAAAYGFTQLPPGFDAWFSRCVVRDPAARFAHGDEATAALCSQVDLRATAPLALPHPKEKPGGQGTIRMEAFPARAISHPVGQTTPLQVAAQAPPFHTPGPGEHSAPGVARPEPTVANRPPSRVGVWIAAGFILLLAGGGAVTLALDPFDLLASSSERASKSASRDAEDDDDRRNKDEDKDGDEDVEPEINDDDSKPSARADPKPLPGIAEYQRNMRMQLVPSPPATPVKLSSIPTGFFDFERMQGGEKKSGRTQIAELGHGFIASWLEDGPAPPWQVGMALRAGDRVAIGFATGAISGIVILTTTQHGLSGITMSSNAPGALHAQDLVGAPAFAGTHTFVSPTDPGLTGEVDIERNGDRIDLVYRLNRGRFVGIGFVDGDHAFIGWTPETMDVGIVVYDVASSPWRGRMRKLGDPRVFTEELSPDR